MRADDAGVAGHFLILAKARAGVMGKRVEPEQAAQQRCQRIGMQVAGIDVRAFVHQHHVPLLRVEAMVEIARHNDARAPYAHHRRQAGIAIGLQQVVMPPLQAAQMALESALLSRHPAEHGQHAPTPQAAISQSAADPQENGP